MEKKKIQDNIIFSDKSLTKRIIYDKKDVLVFVLNFKKGQELPIHKHETSTVVYKVLSGSGEVKINDDVEKIEEGDIGIVRGEDDFSIPKVNEEMSLYVTISPRPKNDIYAKNVG
jgi:quercetin dioxygenase-like cupin family protein